MSDALPAAPADRRRAVARRIIRHVSTDPAVAVSAPADPAMAELARDGEALEGAMPMRPARSGPTGAPSSIVWMRTFPEPGRPAS